MLADRQTDRQTDMVITILRSPVGGRVIDSRYLLLRVVTLVRREVTQTKQCWGLHVWFHIACCLISSLGKLFTSFCYYRAAIRHLILVICELKDRDVQRKSSWSRGLYLPAKSSQKTEIIRNESVTKVIKNDTINLFIKNCNQHFGNFKP